MQYEIRELTLGGILDQAITLMKNHFGAFFGVVAVTLLPFGLLQVAAQLALLPALPPVPTMEDVLAIQAAQREHAWIFIGLGLLALLTLPIANASLVHIVANAYLGKTTTLGNAIGSSFAAIIPLYWTWILMILAVFLGFMALIIPGIILLFWFSFATQIVVIERVHGFKALERSRAMMRGNIGTAFVLFLMIFIISSAVTAFGTPAIPQVHAAAVAGVLINCVMTIFSSAAMVVFYFSARCKNEQFDLQLLAENVGIADAGPASDDNPYAADD